MYGQCKDCSKLFSCRRSMHYGAKSCDTDFEPKPKPQLKQTAQIDPAKQMKWVQITSTKWEAVGAEGAFYIERSCGLFWSRYVSKAKTFKNHPKKTLKEAKEFCEENAYWEA